LRKPAVDTHAGGVSERGLDKKMYGRISFGVIAASAFSGTLTSMNVTFEWDEHKNLQNRRKHALSFEEVRSLFTTGHDYLEIFDTEHSHEEDRFICIGPIETGIVVVVITEVSDAVIRLISARRATPRESRLYQDFVRERLS
jgi:uncharacterized protein